MSEFQYSQQRPNFRNKDTIKRIQQSVDLAHWSHQRLNEQPFNESTRNQISLALFQHALDLTDATIILIQHDLPGPALALSRPMFEAYVRGLWVSKCADDAQVEHIRETEGFQPWRVRELIEGLSKTATEESEWINRTNNEISTLNDLAHGGWSHISRRQSDGSIEPSYTPKDMNWLLAILVEVQIRVTCELFTLSEDVRALEELRSYVSKLDRILIKSN